MHLRVWLAERLGEASGAENLAGAPWLVYYARALGNKVGKGVDLHSAPPVTGMLTLGHRCSIEPEVDLTGHWIDGDLFHVGAITVGNDATDRRADHAAARRRHRQERRRRTGLRRGRQGQGRPVLEGLARREVRQGAPSVARRATAARAALGGDVRRDVDPARRGPAAGARRRSRRGGLGDPRHRLAADAIVPALAWTPVADRSSRWSSTRC